MDTAAEQQKFDKQFLKLINNERELHNLDPVTLDSQLDEAAQEHTDDIAHSDKTVNHIGSDGSTLGERLTDVGYEYQTAVENVGAGQYTANQVFQDC